MLSIECVCVCVAYRLENVKSICAQRNLARRAFGIFKIIKRLITTLTFHRGAATIVLEHYLKMFASKQIVFRNGNIAI